MEIWTLVKANIRHRKGSFISIVLLMVIISMSVTVILSLKRNSYKSMDALWEKVNPGELTVIIKESLLTDELLSKVEESTLTDRVKAVASVCGSNLIVNGIEDGNSTFIRKKDEYFTPYNSTLDGYLETDVSINKGYIYIPIGIKSICNCGIGDTIRVYTIYNHYYDFTIAGFIADPIMGSASVGWKQVYVSDEDFELMYHEAKEEELANDADVTAAVCLLHIYKNNDADMTSVEFRRELNQETGIIDFAVGSMPKSLSQKYTILLSDIITASLLVFMLMLMVVVLIVMGHSISTSIQMDYTELGILKSYGFSKGKIRLVFLCRYLLAELFGAAVGLGLAVPVMSMLKNIFFGNTGFLSSGRLDWRSSSMLICTMLVISALFIRLMTRKIIRISPVRAISGGREPVYFDSPVKTGISKRSIHAGIALRQFTSNSKQYIGIVAIVSILVFFMMTVMVLGNILNSKNSLEAMGLMVSEISIQFRTELSDEQLDDIEGVVEEYTVIADKYYYASLYLSLNGEETMCTILRNPEATPAVSKGRTPLYDNEIVITDVLAEEYDLDIGDVVAVSHNDIKADYLVVGYNQSMNDVGMVFFMSLDGARKIGIEDIYYGEYSLDDNSRADAIAERINEIYGELVVAEAISEGEGMDLYEEIISMAKILIYIMSVIFALVVIHMVCTKTFLQERRDIGIYKACGFTSGMLRLQFAVRFLIISIIGSLIGLILSLTLSGPAISQMLSLGGVSTISVSYTPVTFILPISIICLCFFVFAYFASRKIKRVETKELVVE